MTPSQLIDVVRRRYNAVGDSFYSDLELYQLMYAAHMEFARETLCIERVYTTTSVSGQFEYSLPDNTISVKRITYDGVKLVPITFREDDALTGLNAATTDTGSSQFYYVWNQTAHLRPIPDTTGLTIKIYSINEPQEITATSVFEIPTLYQMETLNYMLSEMYAKDKDFNSASYYRNLWTLALQNGKKFVQKSKRGDSFIGVQDVEHLNERIIGVI